MSNLNKIGTIYFENHLHARRADGTPVIYHIWTAEVTINGKKYRKKSKNRSVCVRWLERVEQYIYGNGLFPARLNHPGEEPPCKRRKKDSKAQSTP